MKILMEKLLRILFHPAKKVTCPFFYNESMKCIESLLSNNCREWHAGMRDGHHYYRVFKKGINKLRAAPDDIFNGTFVYIGHTKKEALLKAVYALSTKLDFERN